MKKVIYRIRIVSRCHQIPTASIKPKPWVLVPSGHQARVCAVQEHVLLVVHSIVATLARALLIGDTVHLVGLEACPRQFAPSDRLFLVKLGGMLDVFWCTHHQQLALRERISLP